MGTKVFKMKCISTVKSCTVSEYRAQAHNDIGLILTVTCSGDGGRTVNRWVVADDSDVSYDELYTNITKNCKIAYNN
jgi:hypothetical protein